MFILIVALIILYYRQIYNFVFYKNKNFTNDDNLIKFAEKFCFDLKNAYSINYTLNDDLLEQEEAQAELAIIKYQHIISKDDLNDKVLCLFDQYQQDLMSMNFELIAEYTLEPFISKHKHINNLNIRYNYQISEILPLTFEYREELNRFIMQINGEIIRFKVSPKGYVVSGISQLRSFTEYWDIALDANKKSYIVTIYEIKD